MTEISIQTAAGQHRSEISQFYEKCGYSRCIGKTDTILMAQQDGLLVGVVRLCPERGVTVLRGMQVLPGAQRQGIGRRLLKKCVSKIGRSPCYSIPWTHLAEFYASEGFERIDMGEAPDFLADRISEYRERGLDVVMMRKLKQLQDELQRTLTV